ncbi:MAG TPA: hypothetical protein VJT73_16825 [Polyangiaceae bacterium]|nr:hypothetical protein [Polyangiaceae bacterium]
MGGANVGGASVRVALAAALVAALGCARKAPDLTPEGAVKDLLERVARIEADPAQARAVYELMSSQTRAELVERARRASTTSGREMPPEEMLAPGRFSLRFEPRKFHARVVDGRAIVDVSGIDPETDRAEVPCVLENGKWRIEVPLPPLTPVERRPEAG